MRRTIEQIEKNLVDDDRQLLLMIYEELRENNRLLKLIHNVHEQVELPLDDHKTEEKRRGRPKKEETA